MRSHRGSFDTDLVNQAYQAWDAEDWPRAGELLERAVRQAPDARGSDKLWFDAALAYKFLRDWPKAYELGLEAAARARRGKEDPAFWNLGIVATVLRDWATARDCWQGYGLPIPPGEGEILEDFGPTCVRINTATGQEVVWAQRLCPTRARVLNVPLDPGRRFGEVVLHDGVPNGERVFQGQAVPVFDEILLFTPSELPTLSVTVTASAPDDIEALLEAFARDNLGAEPSDTVKPLCSCCSEGSVTQERTVEAGRKSMLLAAPEQRAAELLDRWHAERPDDRSWTGLHPAS
ncbi:tetratricopeptide repeat protein [Plantactinospora sonchi]|uniref:Tetratricopeptide repeat protein n=1 Tax=Plantactinospora sonchi TaxID=1544735 RepID=A0ABU7S1S3_9ACTN